MRKCKVKDCNKKHESKGYCRTHYSRKILGQPLIKRCKDCGRNITNMLWYRRCKRCKIKLRREMDNKQYKNYKGDYMKKNYVTIPRFNLKDKVGGVSRVFTNGVTEQMKPLIPKIKEKVLNDCIKNPRKYLGETQNESR